MKNFFFTTLPKYLYLMLFSSSFLIGLFVGCSLTEPSKTSQPTADFLAIVGKFDDSLISAKQREGNAVQELEDFKKKNLAWRQLVAAEPGSKKAVLASEGVDLAAAKLADTIQQQNQSYAASLIETERATAKVRDKVEKLGDSSKTIWARLYDQTGRFMKWTGPIVFSALVGAILFLALLRIPAFKRMLGRNAVISIGSLSIEFRDLEIFRRDLRVEFRVLDKEISKIYKTEVLNSGVSELFARVKSTLDKAIVDQGGPQMSTVKHRATLYIPGFVGDDLVQATDYLGALTDIDKPTSGRRFSIRYGIIGKAWRLERGLYNHKVSNDEQKLIRSWGLTKREAARQGAEVKSLLALIIQHEGEVLGVIYLEAKGENVIFPSVSDTDMRKQLTDGSGCYHSDYLAQDLLWETIKDQEAVLDLVAALKTLKLKLRWNEKLIEGDGR